MFTSERTKPCGYYEYKGGEARQDTCLNAMAYCGINPHRIGKVEVTTATRATRLGDEGRSGRLRRDLGGLSGSECGPHFV